MEKINSSLTSHKSASELDELKDHESIPKPNSLKDYESTSELDFSIPLTDVLKSTDASAEVWPDFAEQLRPQIERRQQIATAVDQYLDVCCAPNQITPGAEQQTWQDSQIQQQDLQDLQNQQQYQQLQQQYWQGIGELLQNPDYERLAFYLPFESFPDAQDRSRAADGFRQAYLSAWQNLLFVRDIREDFNLGDLPEQDAAQSEPEWVVKAAHLAPWLIAKEFITTTDILNVLESGADEILTRSFLDTLPMLQDLGKVSPAEQQRFNAIAQSLPPQAPALPPAYISPERQAWLDERERYAARPTNFTDAMTDLAQPLSTRLPQLQPEIAAAQQLASALDHKHTAGVIMLGGSRLKGYGRPESDLDLSTIVYDKTVRYDSLHTVPIQEISLQPPRYASLIFDTVWVGADHDIRELQRELAPIYFQETSEQTRAWSAERLERDLVQYRLLQKGYARLCPDTNPEYKQYSQMDGSSSFYETGFRTIATKIYTNSVFIPQVSPA